MIGFEPDQLPSSTLIVCPAVAVPEGFGCFVFAGALPSSAIAPVAADSAWFLPSAFVAVTSTRIVLATSPFETT